MFMLVKGTRFIILIGNCPQNRYHTGMAAEVQTFVPISFNNNLKEPPTRKQWGD